MPDIASGLVWATWADFAFTGGARSTLPNRGEL